MGNDDEKHHSRISLIELRIEEIARAQMLMLQDVKSSLTNFVKTMNLLAFALIAELLIQAVLMVVLVLRDSPKQFRASREGVSITNGDAN